MNQMDLLMCRWTQWFEVNASSTYNTFVTCIYNALHPKKGVLHFDEENILYMFRFAYEVTMNKVGYLDENLP